MGQFLRVTALGFAAILCAAAPPAFWHLGRTETGAPFVLVYEDDERTAMMRFECASAEVVATAYGLTHLKDPDSGEEVGDAPGSTMKGSAAQMALITDKVNAHWVWAEAEPNPAGGWDLTIRLPLDHPGLLAFPRAKMIALVVPKGGNASAVEKSDRPRLAAFLRQCRGG